MHVFLFFFVKKRCEIDHAENKKEQVRILSSFLTKSLVFSACNRCKRAKTRDHERPTTKNWARLAANQPFTAIFDRIFTIFFTPMHAYQTKSLAALPSRNAIVCHVHTTLPCCISSANDIVELTVPVVARRVPEVPFFLQRDPVVRDALAVFDKQPHGDNEEVVSKEPGALQHVSVDNAYKLVAEPALLLQRLAAVRFAECCYSAKFDGTDREEVNPELAAIFREFWDKPGKPQFNAALALHARLLPLSFYQRPLMPLLVYDQSLRPCYWAWPILFRPAPVKPTRQGHQVGPRGLCCVN
jgi:hypothetical protein